MRITLLLLAIVSLLSMMSFNTYAVLHTASHILAEELVGQFDPITTQIAYLEEESVILAIGREDGLRVGQLFEIYSQETDRYLGLVRVIEIRSRNAKTEVVEEVGEMYPGNIADEVPGGKVAVYGFLDSYDGETRFSRSFQNTLSTALSSYSMFQVMEAKRMEAILQEKGLSHRELLEMDIPDAGLLLEAHLLFIGSVMELDESILINVRIQETFSGRMVANSSIRLSKTPYIKELLGIPSKNNKEEDPPLNTTSIHHIEVKPESVLLYEGQSVELRVLCYDEEGFILHHVVPEWSTTGDFIELSSIEGDTVSISGQYPGQGQIRILVEGVSHRISVEVLESPYLSSISVIPEEIELAIGESYYLSVEGRDQYGEEFDSSLTWSILSGSGYLSSTTGREVEVTALSVGEILVEVGEGAIQEQVKIRTYIPMAKVPGLAFPSGLEDDGESVVEEDFFMAKTPVTYELWYSIRIWAIENGYVFANSGREGSHGPLGVSPSGVKGEPVTTVNWSDSIVWCNALSEYLGYDPVYRHHGEIIRNARNVILCNHAQQEDRDGFRLPTTDEWELAARYRGSDSSSGAIEYPQGSGIYWTRGDYASGASGAAYGEEMDRETTKQVAWYRANTESTQRVGQKPQDGNYLGLYDMSGNIWEWCFDGDSEGRIIRGGCWMSISYYLQVGFSFTNNQHHASSVKGFRIVRSSL